MKINETKCALKDHQHGQADIINSMLLMQRVTITSFAETITWASGSLVSCPLTLSDL